MAKRTIILLPVNDPYRGHGATAPQVKDKIRIPNLPNVDVVKVTGTAKAMSPESPNTGTHFEKK